MEKIIREAFNILASKLCEAQNTNLCLYSMDNKGRECVRIKVEIDFSKPEYELAFAAGGWAVRHELTYGMVNQIPRDILREYTVVSASPEDSVSIMPVDQWVYCGVFTLIKKEET